MDLSTSTIAILIASGVVVGFINTLGAGATVISMVIYMMMGMPIVEAAGTNRVSVIIQNLVATISFKKQNLLDIKSSMRLTVPVILGILVGSQIAVVISEEIFEGLFVTGLIFMGLMLIAKPSSWQRELAQTNEKRITMLDNVMLFLAGIYGGAVYVGLGYFLISIFVLSLGKDIIRANALKGFMALVITPFSLMVFAMSGHVNYTYGIIHALGNIVGAYIAARYARQLGAKFIHFLLIGLVIFSILYTCGVIKFEGLN